MKPITIRPRLTLDDEDWKLIEEFCRNTDRPRADGFPEKLTVTTLTEKLLQDVALACRRPGSWEGSNMRQVLVCHGYEI